MIKAIAAVVVGVLALVGADWANAYYEPLVSQLLAAIATAGAVLGFFGVTISVGTLGLTAITSGLHSMSPAEVQGHAATAVAGAVLLAAAST
jgi:hypothetical protein